MCAVFWREDLLAKVASGEWIETVRRASRGGGDKAFRTFRDYKGNLIVETQTIAWIDPRTNQERARLHRFITESGSLGASGYPDPKRIVLEDGRAWSLTSPFDEPCAECGQVGHRWPDRGRLEMGS